MLILLNSGQGAALPPKEESQLLTVCAVGASIVAGVGSKSGNGFRQDLKDRLNPLAIDFIGSQTSGTMEDKQHEGYPGLTVSQVGAKIGGTLAKKPAVILVHVGTNDCNLDPPPEPVGTAPDRLGELIDQIVKSNQEAVVLVSQLIAAKSDRTQKNIDSFNAKLPSVVKKRADAGKRVLVVDMRDVTREFLADDLHPNEEGFSIMADRWKASFEDAEARGWLP